MHYDERDDFANCDTTIHGTETYHQNHTCTDNQQGDPKGVLIYVAKVAANAQILNKAVATAKLAVDRDRLGMRMLP